MSTDLFPQTPAAGPSQPAGRVIRYGDRELRDPGPQFNPADIKAMYVAFFPELGNCDIKEEEKDGITTIRFVKRATTKGSRRQTMSKNHVLTSLKGEEVTSIIPLPNWLAAQLASLDPTENPTELDQTLFAGGPITLGELLALDVTLPSGDEFDRWEMLTRLHDNCLKLKPVPLSVVPLGF